MNESKDLITIIVPAYNAENSIKKCINSLLQQDFEENYKIIVVDDGSVDTTLKQLQSFRNNDIIEILHQKNLGVSSARNKALRRVKSKFVTFVDSDDYVKKSFLKDLYRVFLNNKEIDLSIVGVNHVNLDGRIQYNSSYGTGNYDSVDAMSLLLNEDGPEGYLCNKLFRMKIIREEQLNLDDNLFMGEDLLFCIEYLKYCRKIGIVGSHDYIYVQHDKSMNGGLNFSKENKKYKQIYLNYINAWNKIINNLLNAKYHRAYVNACGRLGRESFTFLRLLHLNGDKDKELQYELYNNSFKFQKDVCMSTSIPTSKKLFFLISIYLPKMVFYLDKFRFN